MSVCNSDRGVEELRIRLLGLTRNSPYQAIEFLACLLNVIENGVEAASLVFGQSQPCGTLIGFHRLKQLKNNGDASESASCKWCMGLDR